MLLSCFSAVASGEGAKCRILSGSFDYKVMVDDGEFKTIEMPSRTIISIQNYEGGFIVDVKNQGLNFQLKEDSAGSVRFPDKLSKYKISILCSTL